MVYSVTVNYFLSCLTTGFSCTQQAQEQTRRALIVTSCNKPRRRSSSSLQQDIKNIIPLWCPGVRWRPNGVRNTPFWCPSVCVLYTHGHQGFQFFVLFISCWFFIAGISCQVINGHGCMALFFWIYPINLTQIDEVINGMSCTVWAAIVGSAHDIR